MNTLVYKIDKTYGGWDYVEWKHEEQVYKTGQTRGHKGHYEGQRIEIEVRTIKELNEVENQLIAKGFKDETRTY